jgi:DNA-binding CsgD family transcriptional regulator
MASLLVGRADKVAALRGLIADLPVTSAAVMVRGEAGIGKTLLVRSVLEEHSGSGVRILRGACAPMSSAMAYGGLDAALGGALGSGVSMERFPSAAAGRARAIALLREALDDEQSPYGTVLLVEDVHWADRSTLDFLSYTTRNLPERRLLVLLTWRDDDGSPEHRSWLAEQLRNPEVVDHVLPRLTLQQTAEQLTGLRPDLSTADITAIHERSAGNPYLNAELATAGSTVSTTLRQVLLARLQRLSPAARIVVAATATIARPLTDEDMLAAVGGDAAAVREACDSGLVIRDAAHGATARHPVLAEVSYEQLLSGERRGLHARLAEHLEAQLTANPSASAVAEVAEQYRRAQDREAMLTWSVRAARAAEAAFALAEAAHWYAIASSVREASDEEMLSRLALAERGATLFSGAGQPAKALRLLDDAIAHADDHDPAIVPALITRTWLRVGLGDTDGALADTDRAEHLAAPDDELTRARILCERGMALDTGSRTSEAVPPTRAALDLARRLGDKRTICRCQGILGSIANRAQRYDEARERMYDALSIARDLAQPEELAMAAVVVTDLEWRLGDIERVLEVVDAVRPELRRLTIERHWLEDLMDGNTVLALFDAGRWDSALARYPDAGERAGLGLIECPLAQIHVARGDVASAVDLQQRSQHLIEGAQPMFKAMYVEVQVQLLLLRDRPREAVDAAVAIAEELYGTDDEAWSGTLLLAGLEAAVAAEDGAAFERLTSMLAKSLDYTDGAAVKAAAAGERSRLNGAPDPAAWQQAATQWHRLRRPYREAVARFRTAEAMLARRDLPRKRQQAAHELDAAQRTAEQLGAAPLLDQIRELAKLARIQLDDAAGEHHEHTLHKRPGIRPPLTDRERQVLALLAAGKTNRQIGAALYMSPKTASVHVTHILEKLGVQTRVQAAAAAVRLGLTDDHARPAP